LIRKIGFEGRIEIRVGRRNRFGIMRRIRRIIGIIVIGSERRCGSVVVRNWIGLRRWCRVGDWVGVLLHMRELVVWSGGVISLMHD
jgi:hypothetical protein